MQKKMYAIGMDIYSEFTSISYLESGQLQPVTLGFGEDNGKYVVPVTLYKRKTTGDWLIGEEAVFEAATEAEEPITGILDLALNEKKKYIQGEEYEGRELLKIYLQTLYGKIQEVLGFSELDTLMVTAEEVNRHFVEDMQEIFCGEEMGIEAVRFLSHREAFAYYVLNCKKDLRANDVTLFHMDKKHFICQTFTSRREKDKNTVIVTEEDLSDIVSYEMLKNPVSAQIADEKFCKYLVDDYRSHIVSCVLFTGVGFYENWYQTSINEICKKRRAFKGFNLYSEGACAGVILEKQKDVCVYCDGRTWFDIGICLDMDSGQEVYPMSQAAVNWTEAGNVAEFILDDVEAVELSIRSRFQKETEVLTIDLQELPLRKDKTMCVEIRLEYEDGNTFVLTVRDMGFGDMFPSSGAVVKRKIALQ